MSDFTAIRAVSQTLKSLLESEITHSSEPELSGVPINLHSPKEMKEQNSAQGISLWLYRVTRNPDMLNRPPERIAFNQVVPVPLPINLYYLVTPIFLDPAKKQTLLGKVLQIFQDHAILRGSDLKDTLAGSEEELHLTLETFTVEELTRIWHALQESYLISLPYRVQVVTIHSDREAIQSPPVLSKESDYKQIRSVT